MWHLVHGNCARNGRDSPKHKKFVYLNLHFLKIPMDSVALRCNTIKRTVINTNIFIQLKHVFESVQRTRNQMGGFCCAYHLCHHAFHSALCCTACFWPSISAISYTFHVLHIELIAVTICVIFFPPNSFSVWSSGVKGSQLLTCHCHKISRVEAVGLKKSNYTFLLKITIFVSMCNLGQIREKLIFRQ